MLVELTLKCEYECTHCLVEGGRNGRHMEKEVAEKTVKYLKKVRPPLVQLTGGEITEHPQFYEIASLFTEAAKSYGGGIFLESNGSFKDDETKVQKMSGLLKKREVVGLQVRTHSLYYQNYQEIVGSELLKKLPKTRVFDDGINELYPLGRAVYNHPEKLNRSSPPSCSNLFLLPRQGVIKDMSALTGFMQLYLKKFCKPTIGIKGIIYAGETWHCVELGNVEEEPEVTFENILTNKPCNKCGLVGNLPEEARKILAI